jgi:hypothetical protein
MPLLQQQTDDTADLVTDVHEDDPQRGVAVHVPRLELGTRLQENLRSINLVLLCGEVQRREAGLVRQPRVFTMCQERAQVLHEALKRRVVDVQAANTARLRGPQG